MTVLAIPAAISSAVSLLSHHAHKKGVHGAQDQALDGASNSSGGAPSGSQSLFGSLLDSAEQLIGIQTPAGSGSGSAASGANHALNASNGSKLSPNAGIAAARSALQKT